MESYRPMRDLCLVEALKVDRTSGGLHLPEQLKEDTAQRGRVLSVGDAFESGGVLEGRLKAGDVIIADWTEGFAVRDGCGVVPWSAVLCVVDNPREGRVLQVEPARQDRDAEDPVRALR